MATIETTNPNMTLAPGGDRAFGVDWRELLPDGVTLSSVAAASTPAGLTVGATSVVGSLGSVRLTAPTNAVVGTLYEVVLTGTWSNGEVDPRWLYVVIAKKS
jgi:hypothetical protein